MFRDCAVPWAATGQGGSGGDTAWGGNGIAWGGNGMAWGGVGKGGAIVEILYFPSSVAPESERVFRNVRFHVFVREEGLAKGKSRLFFCAGRVGRENSSFFFHRFFFSASGRKAVNSPCGRRMTFEFSRFVENFILTARSFHEIIISSERIARTLRRFYHEEKNTAGGFAVDGVIRARLVREKRRGVFRER